MDSWRQSSEKKQDEDCVWVYFGPESINDEKEVFSLVILCTLGQPSCTSLFSTSGYCLRIFPKLFEEIYTIIYKVPCIYLFYFIYLFFSIFLSLSLSLLWPQ